MILQVGCQPTVVLVAGSMTGKGLQDYRQFPSIGKVTKIFGGGKTGSRYVGTFITDITV